MKRRGDGSQVLSIIGNRFKLMLRNRLFILLCILLPLTFSIMVDRIFEKTNLYEAVPIAVIDRDGSPLSQKIVEDIKDNPALDLHTIEENEIEGYLSKERVQAVYVFKSGFEENIQKGQYEDIVSVYAVPGSITAMGVSDIIAGEIIPSICQYKVINAAEGLLPSEERQRIIEGINMRIEEYQSDHTFKLPVLVDTRTPQWTGDQSEEDNKDNGDTFSVSIGLGLIIIFTTIFMLTGCSNIIKERENKVRNRIKTAGVASGKLLIADILAVALAGIIITVFQFIMMHTVLKGVSFQGLVAIALLMLVYTLAAATMLNLVASIFPRHISFQSFMPIVILVMGILSGCIWSLEMMPAALGKLAAFMPTYWVHDGLAQIILYGGGIHGILYNLAVLLAMAGAAAVLRQLLGQFLRQVPHEVP
ncbi:ABC transporter permease [Clostridium thermarum]|uniref:ABC transporter permease n=1 Tax=Clostridium thermarum TaxID=1716543 RepID=UPI0013D33609|nr:ABC transporter permease [Clostridium thermarum]